VRVFTPIIPNSQLIITANGNDDKQWKLELFGNPIQQLIIVVFAAAIILFLSAIVIIILHLYEKKEDEKNRV